MDQATLNFVLLALQTAPVLVSAGEDFLASIHGGLTPSQRAELEAGQAAAHEALQAAVKRAEAEENGPGE